VVGRVGAAVRATACVNAAVGDAVATDARHHAPCRPVTRARSFRATPAHGRAAVPAQARL
jgi:hypothetical protein